MKCYSPEQLPVLTTLAREFAVCDHWFSSVPGPTWPNRFFVHTASSGGLDHSPSRLDAADSVLFNGYKFENRTIYDRLDDEDLNWTIYKGDAFPQALAISGMNVRALEGCFKEFEDFSSDVNNPGYATSYAFIEPNYGHAAANFTCGNSQHPLDDVTRGDRLVKTVYETIRTYATCMQHRRRPRSNRWQNTCRSARAWMRNSIWMKFARRSNLANKRPYKCRPAIYQGASEARNTHEQHTLSCAP